MTTFALTNILTLVIAAILAAGGVWALLKQKTVVDEKGNATSVEIPFMGKLQTNYPSLVASFIGAALAVFVVQRTPIEVDKTRLTARLLIDKTQPNSAVIIGAVPTRYMEALNAINQGQENSISFDVDRSDRYSVIAFTPNPVGPDARFTYTVVHGQAQPDTASNGLVFVNKLIGGN